MRWPDPRVGKTRQLNLRPGFIILKKEMVFIHDFLGYCIIKSKIRELIFFNVRNRNLTNIAGLFVNHFVQNVFPFYRILIRSTGVTGN